MYFRLSTREWIRTDVVVAVFVVAVRSGTVTSFMHIVQVSDILSLSVSWFLSWSVWNEFGRERRWEDSSWGSDSEVEGDVEMMGW